MHWSSILILHLSLLRWLEEYAAMDIISDVERMEVSRILRIVTCLNDEGVCLTSLYNQLWYQSAVDVIGNSPAHLTYVCVCVCACVCILKLWILLCHEQILTSNCLISPVSTRRSNHNIKSGIIESFNDSCLKRLRTLAALNWSRTLVLWCPAKMNRGIATWRERNIHQINFTPSIKMVFTV